MASHFEENGWCYTVVEEDLYMRLVVWNGCSGLIESQSQLGRSTNIIKSTVPQGVSEANGLTSLY